MPFFRFEFRKPQMLAAVILLLFAFQCCWIARHQTLTQNDLQYAHCGREIWAKVLPPIDSFRTCDLGSGGTFAPRLAGLPLALAQGISGKPASFSTLQMRYGPHTALLLLRLPFILFGIWLGGGIWWVSRRLYGNEGGFLALVLYCFSPAILKACVRPNNEILAAWGLYGALYTAIGLAHAMQGPRRKWRPRLVLLAAALGLTAAANIVASIVGIVLALGFMLYLAENRWKQVLPVLSITAAGGFLILAASYGFHISALRYAAGRMGPAARSEWIGAAAMLRDPSSAGIAIAAVAAFVLYLVHRRSRYFGNTTPLIVAILLFAIAASGIEARPSLWALPFLLTFIGGVLTDMLESRHRRIFLSLAGAVIAVQVVLTLVHLPQFAS